MGTYTEYWNSYMRKSRKDALIAVLFLVVGLPATAVIAWLSGLATGKDPVPVQIGLILLWLVLFTARLLRGTKIVCPKCSTVYAHSKWQLQCPSCGLRILQEEP